MRALFKLILWLIVLTPLAVVALAWFALSDQALVLNESRLSHQDIARARTILEKHDPRRKPAGTEQQIVLSEHDLNLAANYLLQKVSASGARVRIHDGFLDAVGTLRVPGLPQRQFLNVSLEIVDEQGLPKVRNLALGAIKIPPLLARFALNQALAQLYQTEEYRLASNLVNHVSMRPRELQFTYRHDPELMARARSTLISRNEALALSAYYEQLLQAQANKVGLRGPLTDLLTPMFSFAKERSRKHDPVLENQALLTVLGAWASNRGLSQLVPDAKTRPAGYRLHLQRRTDFGQHFLTSAALAARGDRMLADAVGLAKEIADSEQGSGFSFTDIAADRAGTRFGELAVASEQDARRVQDFMARGADQYDFMPPARDLPEHMTRKEFEERFGGIGSPAYQSVMQEIESRLDSCRLYSR